MSSDTAAVRSLIVYAICIPLAIILGFLITDPQDKTTDFVYGIVLFLLMLPLLFRWYHAWLITIWNMSITFTFLPGYLPGWMPVSCIAIAIALGHYALSRDRKFIEVPSVAWSLVCLGLVVAITAKFRGGIGFHAFGDESIGGKRYLWIWVAIVGYFALVSQPVPPQKRRFYTTLFLLSTGMSVISEFAAYSGPASHFLNIFFPGGPDNSNPLNVMPVAQDTLHRYGGVSIAGMAIAYTLVARYGIEGVLNLRKLWRPILFFSAVAASFFGGYRSEVIGIGLTLVLMFCFEGLLRSRLMPIVVLAVLLCGALAVCFAEQLPLSVQRCLAVLPIKVSSVAEISAEASTDWRLQIWNYLLPQVPHYLLLGKGLVFEASDMAMYQTLGNQEVMGDVGGGFTLAGDYHNGPLSLIIPFGIWGALTFIWFLVASTKALLMNYKYGDPDLRLINTFLLSFFISKILVFFIIFGGFYSDLAQFVGLIGFSISLNNGVAKRVSIARPQPVLNRLRRLPLERPVPIS